MEFSPTKQYAFSRHAKPPQNNKRKLAPYQADPAAFIRDCFDWRTGEGPTSYQEELSSELLPRKRISPRGPHTLGKTAWLAWIILWFALTRDAAGIDWKIPTTASAWRHLSVFLWPEIHKWTRRLRWDKLGREPFSERTELLAQHLKLRHGEAFAVASNRAEFIEGAHADAILYVCDEAKLIPVPTWDAIEGALSGAGKAGREALIIGASTPGPPSGRFYQIQSRKPGYEDWWVRFIRLEEVLASGRMDPEWAAQRLRQWGEKSPVYQNRVLGEFADSSQDGVIPLAWIEDAIERWYEWRESGSELGPLTAVSLDVADGGEDRSILVPKHGLVIPEIRDVTQPDPHATMALAGLVAGVVQGKGGKAIVDSIGVGAGVVSRLRELGVRVEAFNAAEGTDARDRSGELGMANVRAAGWWGLRERLHPESGDGLALPDDDTMIGDLTAPTWRQTSAGKILIESKEDIRKRLGRSTDKGDGVVMVCYESKKMTPTPMIRFL